MMRENLSIAGAGSFALFALAIRFVFWSLVGRWHLHVRRVATTSFWFRPTEPQKDLFSLSNT